MFVGLYCCALLTLESLFISIIIMILAMSSTKRGILILLFLFSQTLLGSAFDFASHQFNLCPGIVALKNQNTTWQVPLTLPAAYSSSFRRGLALAGISFQISNMAEFQMHLEPYIFPTTETVTLTSGSQTYFYTVSVYIVFVNTSSSWVWLYNSTFTCQLLNDENSAVLYESIYVNGPPVIGSTTSDFQVFPYITFYHAETSSNIHIGFGIQASSWSAPNQYVLHVFKYAGARSFSLGYMMLVLNKVEYANIKVVRSRVYSYRTYFNRLTPGPTNFNTPSIYSNSPFGGYDGYCLFGIMYIFLGGDVTAFYDRSAMFDAHTNPFSDLQNNIPYNGAVPQSFYILWNSLCLITCSEGYYYISPYSCLPCIALCLTCSDSITCTVCIDGYGPSSNQLSCVPCLGLTITCSNCLNSSYCTTCINDSYGLSGNHLCLPCPSLISGCHSCINSSYCLACTSDQYYLTQDHSICLLCSLSLSYCQTCDNSSSCTSCIDDTHYVGMQRCRSCSVLITNCLTCTANTSFVSCLTCQQGYYLSSPYTCNSCSDIPNCLDCQNGSYCQTCLNSSLTYSPTNNSCLPCGEVYSKCLGCNSHGCISCPQGSYFSEKDQACQCILGEFVTGICIQIVGCVSAMRESDGTPRCISCDSIIFYDKPINGVCQCLKGTLLNQVCSLIQGCLTPFQNSEGTVCLFCNTTANFQGNPQSDGNCLCLSNYQVNNGTCQQICGDGYLFNTTRGACDDGNIENGDGCSSKCEIEVGFRCLNGSQSTPSVCVYGGIMTLTLDYIERTEGLNQGTFRFIVYPPLLKLSTINLTNHLSLTCNSSYKLSSLKYENGILSIVADYTTDMEGLPCQLLLTFDKNLLENTNISLSFQAISRNTPLIISQYIDQYKTFKSIFRALSYLVLGLFLLSLPHKMIGAELLFNCQIVLISNALYTRPSFLFSSVKNFGLVSGDWSFFYTQEVDQNVFYPFSDRVQLTSDFLSNSLFLAGILFCFGTFLALFKVYHLMYPKKREENRPSRQTKISLVPSLMLNWLLFPVALSFLLVLMISSFVSSLNGSDLVKTFPTLIRTAALFLVFLISASVLACELRFQLFPEQIRRLIWYQDEKIKPWYVLLFLIRLLTIALLIEIGIDSSFDIIIYVISALSVSYIVLLILFKPYCSIFHNFGALLCEFGSLFAISLAMIHKHVSLNELYELFLMFILQGVICLMVVISLIRLVLTYRHLYNKHKSPQKINSPPAIGPSPEKRPRQQSQNLQSEFHELNPYRRQRQPTLNERILNPAFSSIFEETSKHPQRNDKQVEEDEYLKSIKDRLRNNFRSKLFQKKERGGSTLP